MTCNDEIYSLKAVAATIEAELKYSTEQELANMQSELKFRVSSFENWICEFDYLYLHFIFRHRTMTL